MAILIKTIILIIVASLWASGWLPIVPYDGVWKAFFIISSLGIFLATAYIGLIRPLKEKHSIRKILTSAGPMLFIIFIIPTGSAALGFCFANAIFIPFGLIAKFTEETLTAQASCIGTYDGTKTAISSKFLFDNGEKWKIYSFNTCANSTKQCTLEYSEFLFSRYIKEIDCHNPIRG